MTHWDETTDVLIVGSGAAGLSAAVEAAQSGCRVMVVEKMKLLGGNTRISDGGLAAPGNNWQRARGIKDDPDLFYQDMVRAGMGLNHPALVREVAENALDAVQWTIDPIGVEYQDRLDRFGGHSVARCITTRRHSGVDLIRALHGALADYGVTIHKQRRLQKFLTDAAGRVCGASFQCAARSDNGSTETPRRIHARKGVILATGGFGNDIAFRTLHHPRLDASVESTNHRGATAEGLIAAIKINAASLHLSRIQLGPWGCPDEKRYGKAASFAAYSLYPNGIVVDPASATRIMDEWADRRRRSNAILDCGHPCVGIVDTAGAQTSMERLGGCLKKGSVVRWHTIREAAAHYRMPAEQLEKTVAEYNRGIAAGEQDVFGKALQNAAPIAHPPFYTMRLWPKVHYTPGGVCIDPRARVLNLNGHPIPGLFAAGEVCGGIHGASRLGSCALTECIVFGRIAGQQAARG